MIKKVDILAIGAHPDDIELGCGGTLAKLISEGKRVAVLDLTKGELGTRGTSDIRCQEAILAAKILGVQYRENLNLRDGFLINSGEYQLKIIEKIRKYQPKIVFCNALDDRHPDHSKAAKLVLDACFLSGLIKIQTCIDGELQGVWRPNYIFHYIQWKDLKPDFVFDITDFLHIKIRSCEAYVSQFYNPNSKEPLTPISTKDFYESITYRAQNLGRQSGVQYAEGFNTTGIVAFKNFDGIVW